MVAAETTMEARLATIMASLSESRELLASSLRRLEVKEPEGQVATTTRLMFGQDRVREKTETKPLSSSLISTHRDLAVGPLHEETVLAPARPTRCSTNCLASNVGNHQAAVSSEVKKAMGVAATTTDAALAASMAGLKLSIERMKEIAGRSKSTDATLARIARAACGSREELVLTPAAVEHGVAAVVSVDGSPAQHSSQKCPVVTGQLGASQVFDRMPTVPDDKRTHLEDGIGGAQVVFVAVLSQECELHKPLLSGMQYGSNNASFSFSWDPGGCSLQIDPNSTTLKFSWDPGNLLRFFQSTTSNQSLVVPSTEGKWQQLLSHDMQPGTSMATLFLSWDPGTWIIVAEIAELSTVRTSETRRRGQNLGILPEDIFRMALNRKLSLRITQLATQIWDQMLDGKQSWNHNIHNCQDFFPLAISTDILQYRPWDPGLHSSVCAVSVEIIAARARDKGNAASFLPRVCCRIWSYHMLRLRHGQAVAWGQATFCRGGSVTPAPTAKVGYIILGRAVGHMGLSTGSTRGKGESTETGWNRTELNRPNWSSLRLLPLSLSCSL